MGLRPPFLPAVAAMEWRQGIPMAKPLFRLIGVTTTVN